MDGRFLPAQVYQKTLSHVLVLQSFARMVIAKSRLEMEHGATITVQKLVRGSLDRKHLRQNLDNGTFGDPPDAFSFLSASCDSTFWKLLLVYVRLRGWKHE